MKQIKWFDRQFDFTIQQNIFPAIKERLRGTPIRLTAAARSIPDHILGIQPNNTWSIKENIGHLTDLEVLWQGRLKDILAENEFLRSWDLENNKTHTANHNRRDLDFLLFEFTKARKKTMKLLAEVKEEQVYWSALHPRLKQPMRMMDLFLFVADHDDHHLARITELKELLG